MILTFVPSREVWPTLSPPPDLHFFSPLSLHFHSFFSQIPHFLRIKGVFVENLRGEKFTDWRAWFPFFSHEKTIEPDCFAAMHGNQIWQQKKSNVVFLHCEGGNSWHSLPYNSFCQAPDWPLLTIMSMTGHF